ncbi:hypothetical protein C4J87_1596 [Pseudomonas sp. R1-43-08]|nr:hypothetical protein C4J87_1596 [Pseudomonas sp. R1-43-08]AZF52072.1 hypothetical protein C4J85_1573 [Pseudomonas sp. R4-34-07]
MHGAISACGRKAYQSCRFIRKTKNYNALSLSLNVASDIVPGPLPLTVSPLRALPALKALCF